jgi:outer membrane lipopolysaccharide assembly protein LptE/RlpB
MRTLTLLLTLALVALLAGCGQDSRLQGKWTFDRATTEAELAKRPPEPEGAQGDFLGSMKKALASTLVPTLIEKLDGATLTITRNEMIMTTKDGTGKVEKYEVIERPAQDTWRVKTSDNRVETYTRRGDLLSSPASGDVQLTAYFKRVK